MRSVGKVKRKLSMIEIRQSSFFQFAFFFLIAIFFNCQNNETNKTLVDRPNIIIIFTDDQGYQDLGCYGSPDIKTPYIDQMAQEGVRFTNFYVSQGVCSASRASLLTGCYADRLGISGAYMPYVGKGLHPDEETIAEILKDQGYATACYGKWHLGSEDIFLPTRQGFDEFYGILYSNDMWPLHPWQGSVFNFPDLPLFENESIIDTLHDQSHLTKEYTKRAISFIKENADQPFFLYVPHSMPHVPLFRSKEFEDTSDAGIYGDVIEEIDWSTGQILEALERENIDENTLVIFTSDNGPWLSYGSHSGRALPLREGKGTALEGGVRVPCVMRWPGHIPAGRIEDKPAMTIDLLPTIAKLTQADMPKKKIDGTDIDYLLKGSNPDYYHHEAYFFYYKKNELHGVLSGDGRWKLYLPHSYRSLNGRIGTKDGIPIDYNQQEIGLELYDLKNDISETKDVSEANPEIVKALLSHAENARLELGDSLKSIKGKGVRSEGKL